jgi:glycosyltransferase involved in cell wall biosynthesis
VFHSFGGTNSLAGNSMTHLGEQFQTLRVALVHHWLVRMRGGEKVLAALCRLFPQADIFTLVYDPEGICETITRHRVTTSWIQRLPLARRHYAQYLPLFPLAIEQFDLSDYDLAISSDASVAKGVLTRPETCHICYCHSPLRYAWSAYHTYLEAVSSRWKRGLVPFFLHYLRLWDVSAANRVDYFVANSRNVANRIQKYYRREASVVYPPVEVSSFPVPAQTEDYYLAVGQWVPYKRFDLAIEAFNELRRPLWVVGEGPEEPRLKRRAQSHIRFLSRVSDSQLRTILSQCRALVFPGEEDFGMIIPETHACGRPAIALARGGALETVIPGVNGVLFQEASAAALRAAVLHFESIESQLNPQEIRVSAERFKEELFFEKMAGFVAEKLAEHQQRFSLESQKSKPSALVR